MGYRPVRKTNIWEWTGLVQSIKMVVIKCITVDSRLTELQFNREKKPGTKINPSILTKSTQYIPLFMQVAHSPVSIL